MTKPFDADIRRIDGLFEGSSEGFSIPPFQRRYAWGAEEVQYLISDLYDDLDWKNNKEILDDIPYFLGSIVVITGEKTEPSLVLDGQQRLTTLSLMLAVLRQKLIELNTEDSIKFSNDLAKYLEWG